MRRRFKSSGIREKLTIWLLAVFALLSVLYMRAYHDRYLGQLDSLLQAHQNTAELVAGSVDSDLEWLAYSQVSVGNYLLDRQYTAEAAGRYLRTVCSSRPHHISQTYVSVSGENLASSAGNIPKTVRLDAVDVREALSGKSPVIIGPHLSDGGKKCITVSTPIHREGRIAGVMRSEVSADIVGQHLPREIGARSEIMLINKDGSIIYCSALPPEFSHKDLLNQKFVKSALSGQPKSETFVPFPNSEPYLGSAVSLRSGNWILISASPAAGILGQARGHYVHGLYTSIGLTAALMVFFWWWCGVFIVGNLRRLTRAASALAVGDLRKRIPVSTSDELGSLAQAFNQMAESLQTHDRQIERKSAALQSLLDVAHAVTSSLDLQTVASAISQAVNRRFGAAAVAVYMQNEDVGNLELLIYHSYNGNEGSSPPDEWTDLAQRAHKNHACETVAISNCTDHPAEAEDDKLGQSRLLVGVPLVGGDQSVGAMVMSFDVAEFPEPEALQEHMELMQGFGSHAAIALRNARTYANAEQYARSLSHWLDELSALRYVTEAITVSLDLQEILNTLSRLTCDVMRARACAISLMTSNGVLKVEEAYGISPRLREVSDCKIGEPISGMACKDRRPVAVKDLSKEYSGLPIAVEAVSEGFHAYLSVPLISGRQPIGTIDIWKEDPHDFTAYEIDLLSSIAAHAAMAIRNARMFGKEYRIADTLQNVILGSIPDQAPGLKLGSKYVPALEEARVGGDFYDLIDLPGGKIGIVIADVSGKGLAVAKHTAMCKFMLRGFALQWPDQPAKALDVVNEALCCYSHLEFFVTIFYCVFDPTNGELAYANAGHPPAIWITEGGERQTLLYQTGIPVGMDKERSYQGRSIRLSADDIMVLYTDGLMEATNGAETLGIEGVQDMLFSSETGPEPESLVEGLYTDALQFASEGLRDDMAIVAFKVVGSGVVGDAKSDPDNGRTKNAIVEEGVYARKDKIDTGN